MFVLGIIGGVASGKSLAAQSLTQRGAILLDGDRAGHAVLQEPEVIRELVERFGPTILDSQGAVDRRAVAKLVFGHDSASRDNREFLNALTHPRIRARLEGELAAAKASGVKLAVLDAALMLETGWKSLCHAVVFIDTPLERRRAFAAARGWSDEEFARREAAQWSVERKREAADLVIANDGTPAELAARMIESLGRTYPSLMLN